VDYAAAGGSVQQFDRFAVVFGGLLGLGGGSDPLEGAAEARPGGLVARTAAQVLSQAFPG
jgi:hypothetical protein